MRMHQSNDPVSWDDVIVALNQILTLNNMKRLETRLDDDEAREGFEHLDPDVYHAWKASFIGIGRYHLIMCGVS